MVTRREFLKGLGALAVAPAVLAVLPGGPPETPYGLQRLEPMTVTEFRARYLEPAVVPLADKIDAQIASMYSELAMKL
jgi:hypothetical protein